MTAIAERVNDLLRDLQSAADRQTYRHKDFFVAYPKQVEFCDMGIAKRERLLSAGNQLGKTEIGAFEVACHLTGEYPNWWLGKRWDRPTKCWVSGVTGLLLRDIVQKKLCGEPGLESAFGTGMIPRENFVARPTLARGTSDLFDTAAIKHISGGTSIMKFKSYEQGREKWQGDTLDFLWYDEEPPQDIYDEGLMRLNEGGMVFMTFTPLQGMTKVAAKFFDHDLTGTDRGLVVMTDDDVTHFTAEEKAKRRAAFPAYQHRARFRGLPAQGEGAVFSMDVHTLLEDAIAFRDVPKHWVWLWGLDFGIGHPFAAVLIAWDRDADVIHIMHAMKASGVKISDQVRMMKPWGYIPVAWPHDGNIRDRGDLTPQAMIYKQEGAWMLPKHATFEAGGYSTEAGITEMDERFRTGRLKVAKHLLEWIQEFERYHRKDGLLVKQNDDIMSATRVAVMAKRFARPHGPRPGTKPKITMADGIDFDLFS